MSIFYLVLILPTSLHFNALIYFDEEQDNKRRRSYFMKHLSGLYLFLYQLSHPCLDQHVYPHSLNP